jgi:DNA-binding MarR family transcriptional regulator
MHAVPFKLKRAYQSTLSVLRRFAKPYGLTPARYDLLRFVANRSVRQSAIHKALGVTRATTSRMLISLERLRLIRREHGIRSRRKRTFRDRRALVVELTDEGRRLVRAVRNSIIAPWFQLVFESYFQTRGATPFGAFLQCDTLIFTLYGIAKDFGDTAEHIYPIEDPDSGPDPYLPLRLSDTPSPDPDEIEEDIPIAA